MSLATNAALYLSVANVLRDWGWQVDFEPGWATRTNGSTIRTPSAVTVHHTGGKATATSYLLNPRDRPHLKVLANMHITRDHRIKILAAGSTSHGGYTHEACYQRVVQGTAPLTRDLIPGADSKTFSINTRTVGIEVDGAGGRSEWDVWMTRAVVAVSAAWQIVTGWMKDGKAARVGAHKEHTLRKPGDPYMSMGELRSRVHLVVASGEPYGPTETPPVVVPPVTPPKPVPPVDPPEVPVPVDPQPPVVEPVTAVLSLGVANCQSYGGDNSERAYRARARIMASKGWTVIALCETTESGRKWLMDELYKATGHRWAVWTLASKSVALIWDDRIWSPGNRRTVSFGTSFGHGAVLVPLTHRATKLGVDVMSVHVRPKSIATPAQKAADVAKAEKLAKGWPCVFAGDFALDAPKLPGWIRVTPVVDTVKSDGGANSRVDAAFIRGKIGAGKSIVVDPGALSDHKWLGVTLVLGGGSTL